MSPDHRRRDPETRAAILRAVLDICAEQGYAKLNIEAVARRAGAGKQTVYRWWSSLPAVVMEAISDIAEDSAAFPDTGDLRADLAEQMHAVARAMASPAMGPYTGLIGDAQRDPELAGQIYGRIVEPRIRACVTRIEKAQASGEIRADVPAVDVVELVYAPLYYRLLLHSRAITEEQVDRVLDLAFSGLEQR